MIKKYEKYKDSGIEWVNNCPDNWKITKYKFFCSILNGYPFKSELFDNEIGMPLIRIRDITSGEINTYYKGQYEKEYIVTKGDLVIGMDGDFNLRWWDNKDALLNQRCCKVLANEFFIELRFLYYLLPFDLKIINDLSYYTTVKHLSHFDIYERTFVLPNKFEQTQIARFLDHKTGIIDSLIAKKERLIELLKEKRQAIINEAVTKGLNLNVKMKDSGMEWLGEVPEGWEVVFLRQLTEKVGSGVTPKGGAEVYSDEGIIFVRSQNVHFAGLRLDDVVKIDTETHLKMSGSKVEYKDVLLNITGASIGRCCLVESNEEMNVNQHVCIIRPKNSLMPEYLNLILQSNIGQIQVKLGTTGGNREGLTFEAIKDFLIPVPEIHEQNTIVNKISEALKKYELLINKNIEQIEKLKEYRQSLISEAVTGKIDVREWEALNI